MASPRRRERGCGARGARREVARGRRRRRDGNERRSPRGPRDAGAGRAHGGLVGGRRPRRGDAHRRRERAERGGGPAYRRVASHDGPRGLRDGPSRPARSRRRRLGRPRGGHGRRRGVARARRVLAMVSPVERAGRRLGRRAVQGRDEDDRGWHPAQPARLVRALARRGPRKVVALAGMAGRRPHRACAA